MEFDIQHIRVSKNVSFLDARTIYKKNSWKEGNELCWGHQGSKPVHISTQTDVSWVGAQPVTRKQCPAASVTVTSRPVPSVSRSVGTTTLFRGGETDIKSLFCGKLFKSLFQTSLLQLHDPTNGWLCGVGLEWHHCLYPGMS